MDPIYWHRLFGLILTDLFSDSPFVVEMEVDLSIKQQFLDVVILRKRPGRFEGDLPDGFDCLKNYNLITFKSLREPLKDWSIKELVGHYVNFRKQSSPSLNELLPEREFQLLAVCSRRPRQLTRDPGWSPISPGVYSLQRGTDAIRVIVTRELPESEANAGLNLFSFVRSHFQYGATNYRQRTIDMTTILGSFIEGYRLEEISMPYTVSDLERDVANMMVARLKPEESLQHLTPKEVIQYLTRKEFIQRLTPVERLEGLNTEERLQGLNTEERLQGLKAEERLHGLSSDVIASALTDEQLRSELESRRRSKSKRARK